jgi:hypothetical protein
VFEHRGSKLEARLLRSGVAELEQTDYDNWNGGTYTYAFVVRVPVKLFALLADRQDEVEKRMLDSLGRLLRAETHNHVSEVILMPDEALALSEDVEQASSEEAHATWPSGHFRLFLSHVSNIKAPVHRLKVALREHGITGFVAHDDIEPTRDWQSVIEGALRTMDALVAWVTPDFIQSKWCDQEVGTAIGRGKLIIPVRLGADPYGFMGRYQGLQGKGVSPADMATLLFDTLAKNEKTSRRLAETVLKRFERADSFAEAKQLMKTLEMFDQIPLELLRSAEPALDANVDIRDAFTVPERFRQLMTRNGATARV